MSCDCENISLYNNLVRDCCFREGAFDPSALPVDPSVEDPSILGVGFWEIKNNGTGLGWRIDNVKQYALFSGSTENSTLSQDLEGVVAGNRYRITFDFISFTGEEGPSVSVGGLSSFIDYSGSGGGTGTYISIVIAVNSSGIAFIGIGQSTYAVDNVIVEDLGPAPDFEEEPEDDDIGGETGEAFISSENFIVVYVKDHNDSKEFAEYYAENHNMSKTDNIFVSDNWEVNGQTVGIACSTSELLSENDFNITVLGYLREALDVLRSYRKIWGIVLGYKVPGGFINSSGKIISSVSRIARGCSINDGVYHTYGGDKILNKIYDRDIFDRFDSIDAKHSLIVSRIDAPTLLVAKSYVDIGILVNQQVAIKGTFYIDPYSDKFGTKATTYTNDILTFYNSTLSEIGLQSWSTVFQDPYIDVAIPFVQNDSFVWSWFSDRADPSFFQVSNAARVFLYNADFDGAYTIRNSSSKTWPILALNSGYAACAGMMENNGIEAFLRPNPFFKALIQGATIGESYYFALPYLDDSMTLFGDPLVTVSFSGVAGTEGDGPTDIDESWYLMSKDLARVSAYIYRRGQQAEEAQDLVVDANILVPDPNARQIEIKILPSAGQFVLQNNSDNRKQELKDIVSRFLEYPERIYKDSGLSVPNPTINDYLTEKRIKVSRLLTDISGSVFIIEDNLLDEGWWEFEYTIQDDSFNFVNYHFELEVSDKEDSWEDPSFNVTLLRLDSFNLDGWLYESEKDVFIDMTSTGVPAGLTGRKVRYRSRADTLINIFGEYLNRGQIYYFRIRQYTLTTDPPSYFEYRMFSDIIYT